jgi:hypothetical protein
MGMIWNTLATLQMIDTLNFEFSQNIAKWQGLRNLFDPTHKLNINNLTNIAANHGLFGGGVQGSAEDTRWQMWLGLLGKATDAANGNHEKLRKAIYDGLDSTQYDAIYFQVVPRPHGMSIKVTAYPDSDDRLMGILVETPTIAAARAAIRTKKRARTKAKAKKKL